MSVQSPEELFVSGLKQTYYTEHKLLDALDELSETSTEETLKEGFEEHRAETENQIDRLEEVFEHLDESPEEMTDPVVDGLLEAHESFMDMDPSEGVMNRHNIAAGQKTEHYEIAAYDDLITLAGQLGYDDARDLLQESLEEERQELETLSEYGEDFEVEELEQ